MISKKVAQKKPIAKPFTYAEAFDLGCLVAWLQSRIVDAEDDLYTQAEQITKAEDPPHTAHMLAQHGIALGGLSKAVATMGKPRDRRTADAIRAEFERLAAELEKITASSDDIKRRDESFREEAARAH